MFRTDNVTKLTLSIFFFPFVSWNTAQTESHSSIEWTNITNIQHNTPFVLNVALLVFLCGQILLYIYICVGPDIYTFYLTQKQVMILSLFVRPDTSPTCQTGSRPFSLSRGPSSSVARRVCPQDLIGLLDNVGSRIYQSNQGRSHGAGRGHDPLRAQKIWTPPFFASLFLNTCVCVHPWLLFAESYNDGYNLYLCSIRLQFVFIRA